MHENKSKVAKFAAAAAAAVTSAPPTTNSRDGDGLDTNTIPMTGQGNT